MRSSAGLLLSALLRAELPALETLPMAQLLAGAALQPRPSSCAPKAATLQRQVSTISPVAAPDRQAVSNSNGQPGVRHVDNAAQRPEQRAARQARSGKGQPADTLQSIDGVGPVGASKLRSEGYDTREQLQQAFQVNFQSDRDRMVQHLKV